MADTKFSFQEVGKAYSPAWMSPEALSRAPEDLNIRAADMWSFAILLWELNTREVPFSDLPPMECGMKVREGFWRAESVKNDVKILKLIYQLISDEILEKNFFLAQKKLFFYYFFQKCSFLNSNSEAQNRP